MSVRKAFEGEWEAEFPGTPIPTNLSFLDNEGVSSLAMALDAAERIMKKLDEELARQRFIRDFVLRQLDLSIAARSDTTRRSTPPSQRGIVTDEQRNSKILVGKTSSGPHYRPHGKASQLAAVMAKFGIGKVNRPAIDPEDEAKFYSVDDSSKKATPVSRFYQKSSMFRASSEPSLLDCERKYKPQPAIPSTTASRLPPGFKPIFTKDEHNKLTTTMSAHTTVNKNYKSDSRSTAAGKCKSTGSDLDFGHLQEMEDPATRTGNAMFLETDLDSLIPPASTPTTVPSLRGDRFRPDVYDCAGPARLHTQHSNIYEEAKEFRREITSTNSENEADDDESVSSDEEPLYFNILMLKQQTLSRANALYTNDADADDMMSPGSSENEKASAKRRLCRVEPQYERINPRLSKPLSIFADIDSGKQTFFVLHVLDINM